MAHSDPTPAPPDPWRRFTRFTSARIALGRTGGSLPTGAMLDFRLAHARARDAVHQPFDTAALTAGLAAAGLDSLCLATEADSRAAHLARPDLGRRLSEASRADLVARAAAWGCRELVVIVSDGLSALAAERHAAPLLAALLPRLGAAGWSIFPICIVPFARVKLQDEVGNLLGARHALMLLGERPGLGSPDSLGAYFTHAPRPACTDADRNCVSNIRPEGLPPVEAARTLERMLLESARLGVSGVALKDTGAHLPGPEA